MEAESYSLALLRRYAAYGWIPDTTGSPALRARASHVVAVADKLPAE